MFKVGDRVRLINVPDYIKEDLGKVGTFKGYPFGRHNPHVDVLLDGDDGLTVTFAHQLVKDSLKRWRVGYWVGNTYKVKYVYAEDNTKAIKKARIKNIVELDIVDENGKVIG